MTWHIVGTIHTHDNDGEEQHTRHTHARPHLIVFIASDLRVKQEALQQIGNSSITSSSFYMLNTYIINNNTRIRGRAVGNLAGR